MTPDGATQTLTAPLHKDPDPGTIPAIYRQATRFVPEAELSTWFHGE